MKIKDYSKVNKDGEVLEIDSDNIALKRYTKKDGNKYEEQGIGLIELDVNSTDLSNSYPNLGDNLDDERHGVIASNIGRQDKEAWIKKEGKDKDKDGFLYDLESAGLSMANFGNVMGLANDLTVMFSGGDIAKNSGKIIQKDSTTFDERNLKIDKLKSDINKEVPLTTFQESPYYNDSTNASNTKSKLLRGDLTQDPTSFGGIWNTIKGKYGIQEDGWVDKDSDLVQLNTFTKEKMYSGKPGHTILAKSDVPNTIDNNTFSSPFSDELKNKLGVDEKNIPAYSNEIFTTRKNNTNNPLNGYNYSNEETKFNYFSLTNAQSRAINILKNKNTFSKQIGNIYVKPFYSEVEGSGSELKGGFKSFEIPFEFNPQISEGSINAKYQAENLLGRIGDMQVYIGTEPSTITLTTEYVALAPDEEYDDKTNKQFSTNIWEYIWTNKKIEEIELKYRSLVFPVVTNTNYLIKPPIIQIKLDNFSKVTGAGGIENSNKNVGYLYKYPYSKDAESLQSYFKISAPDIYKKYVVTSVQIDNLENSYYTYPSLYSYNSNVNEILSKDGISSHIVNEPTYGLRRRGFKVTLQCTEVTENFLDIVPDFASYYNSWNYLEAEELSKKQQLANILNLDMDNIKKTLTASASDISSNLISSEENVKRLLKKAYNIGKLYCIPSYLKETYIKYITLIALIYNQDFYKLYDDKTLETIRIEKDDLNEIIEKTNFSELPICKPKYTSKKWFNKQLVNNTIKLKKGETGTPPYLMINSTVNEISDYGILYNPIPINEIHEKLNLFPEIYKSGVNGISYDRYNYKLVEQGKWKSENELNTITYSCSKESASLKILYKEKLADGVGERFTRMETYNYRKVGEKYIQFKRVEYYNYIPLGLSAAYVNDKEIEDYDSYSLSFNSSTPYEIKNDEILGNISNKNIYNYINNYIDQSNKLDEFFSLLERINKNYEKISINEEASKETQKEMKQEIKKVGKAFSFVSKLKDSTDNGGSVYYFRDESSILSSSFKYSGANNLFKSANDSFMKFSSFFKSIMKDLEVNGLIKPLAIPNINVILKDKKFKCDDKYYNTFGDLLKGLGFISKVEEDSFQRDYEITENEDDSNEKNKKDEELLMDIVNIYIENYEKSKPEDYKYFENENSDLNGALDKYKISNLYNSFNPEYLKTTYNDLMNKYGNDCPYHNLLNDEEKEKDENFYSIVDEDKLLASEDEFVEFEYANSGISIGIKQNTSPLEIAEIKDDEIPNDKETVIGVAYEIYKGKELKEDEEVAQDAASEDGEDDE